MAMVPVSIQIVHSKLYAFLYTFRNGVVRYESVMKLRSKLEELGKMKGVNHDKKG